MTVSSPRAAFALLITLISVLAATLAAGGCGGSTVAAIEPVAEAAEATMHAGGTQMALDATVEGAGLPAPVRVTGSGTFNMSRREGRMQMSMSGLPTSGLGGASNGRLQMSELLTPSALYVSSPLFGTKLPGGAKWVKVDLSELDAKLGIDLQSLMSGQSNPAEILKYMRGKGASVQKVGEEAVRGTPTTHYRGTVDLLREVETLPAKDRPALSKLKQMVAQSGIRTLPVELWIDSRHLLRRLTIDASPLVAGQSVHVKLTIELFGFGPTPAVAPPPSNQVFEAPASLLAGVSG